MVVNFFIDILDRWSLNLLETLKRFPLASLSSFLVTLILIMLIEINYNPNHEIIIIIKKLAFVLSTGIFLFPVLHLLHRSIWFKLLGIVLLGGYFYILPSPLSNSDIVRHILLIFALCFMFFWAPFLNTNISNKNIWEWTMKILLILLATVILSLTLYGSFITLIFSLKELFNIEVEPRRFMQFAVMVLGLFSVNFFLSQMPKYICLLQLKKYTQIGAVFTKYILTPITMVYMLILFAYILRILIFQDWNKVTIDWMIISFSFLAIGTYMFWTPLVEKVNRRFRKLIWGSTLSLSFILALSIYVRFLGGTSFESLYLISLFDVWLALISLYFLLFENASYKWLFFSISLSIGVSQSDYVIDLIGSLKVYL